MKKSRILNVAFIFFILSIVYTYPLILYFNKGIPYTHNASFGGEVVSMAQGDHLQSYYHYWLLKDSLHSNAPFFTNPYEFSVKGIKKFTLRRIPLSFIYLIFSIFGDIFAYNTVIFVAIVAAGLAMFLLAYTYTENYVASLAAALIYALCPFERAQMLGGHPNGFIYGIIPLMIYSYEMIFRTGKIRYAVIAGIALLFPTCIEKHLYYYIVMFSSIYVPLRIIISPSKKYFKSFFFLGVFLMISLAIVFYMKKVNIDVSIARGGRTLNEVRTYSPTIKDIFNRTNAEAERYVYLGIIPFLLTVFGAFTQILKKQSIKQKVIPAFYTLAFIVSFILSLGTTLNNIFPIYKFCYKYVPYFNYPRVPGRMVIISFLAMSVLAAYAVKEIKVHGKRPFLTYIIISILLLGIMVDYFPFPQRIGISLMEGKPSVYEKVEKTIGNKKLLELPIWPGDSSWSSIYEYYVTKTRVKIINGYHPMVTRKYIRKIFSPLVSLNIGEINEKQYELLKKLDVKYIIFHQEAYPPKVSHYPSFYAVERLKASRYLKFLQRSGPMWLFLVLDCPLPGERATLLQPLTGVVKEAEWLHHRTGRTVRDVLASNAEAVFAKAGKDRNGCIISGRQQVFPKGSYKVTFRLKVGNTPMDAEVAHLVVLGYTALGKRREIVRKNVYGRDFTKSGEYQDVTLSYTLKKTMRTEFLVYYTGVADLWCDYVYILMDNECDPCFLYPAERLYYHGNVLKDLQAHGGQAVFVKKRAKGYVLYGPYRRYPKGHYTVEYLIKGNNVSPENALLLDACTDYGTKIFVSRFLKGKDFIGGKYQIFTLQFSLDRERILEFRVKNLGESDFWIDEVKILQ